MSDLVLPIENGKVPESSTTSETKKSTKGTSELGKDAFLQLLVCQLQNQDPLNPSSDTEFISQLATFSQLEQLQNLTSTTENAQLFSLIGKTVTVSSETASGDKKLTTGVVDFVTMANGSTQLSIGGELYDAKQLYNVVDADYYYDQNKPHLVKEVDFAFDGLSPKDLTFEVDMGKEVAKSTDVALTLGTTLIDDKYYSLKDNKVTISADLFQQLPEGTYQFGLAFNDTNYTVVSDKLKVTVKNPLNVSDELKDLSEPEKDPEGDPEGDSEGKS